MEQNFIENVVEDEDPMLGALDPEEDIILEGVVDLEFDIMYRSQNNQSNQMPNDFFDFTPATTPNTPTTLLTLSQPSSANLPDLHHPILRGRKSTTQKASPKTPKKRGRPQKSDKESKDSTELRKRKYARKYQQNRKSKLVTKTQDLQAITQALKDINIEVPQFKGILEAMAFRVPGFMVILQQNTQ